MMLWRSLGKKLLRTTKAGEDCYQISFWKLVYKFMFAAIDFEGRSIVQYCSRLHLSLMVRLTFPWSLLDIHVDARLFDHQS